MSDNPLAIPFIDQEADNLICEINKHLTLLDLNQDILAHFKSIGIQMSESDVLKLNAAPFHIPECFLSITGKHVKWCFDRYSFIRLNSYST